MYFFTFSSLNKIEKNTFTFCKSWYHQNFKADFLMAIIKMIIIIMIVNLDDNAMAVKMMMK